MEDAKATTITFGSPVGYADGLWQIGSRQPPHVCLCCGLSFDRSRRTLKGPYDKGPYRYVCRACWRLPFLFFPDKKLARCGECWIPPEAIRHRHHPVFAPRGARISREHEEARRRKVAQRSSGRKELVTRQPAARTRRNVKGRNGGKKRLPHGPRRSSAATRSRGSVLFRVQRGKRLLRLHRRQR